MMSEHLASMNEQITSQNDKIDQLQQQLHNNSIKVITIELISSEYSAFDFRIGSKKRKKIIQQILVSLFRNVCVIFSTI